MLRCASFAPRPSPGQANAAYVKVRLTPHNSRALPAELLQSRFYNYNLEYFSFNTRVKKEKDYGNY